VDFWGGRQTTPVGQFAGGAARRKDDVRIALVT
jgi:hypothetical protein